MSVQGLGGEEHGEAQGRLEASGAEDDACERWSPVVNAAYYTGLAMGSRWRVSDDEPEASRAHGVVA